jgi:3-methyladenine DNA glycosylase Tag
MTPAMNPRTPPPVKTPKRATPPDRIPARVANPTLDDHLAVLSRAIFQAGLSWAFMAARWDDFLAAFDGFSIVRVAGYGEADIERIMEAPGVVHSRSKIAATIQNAQALQAIEREFGSVAAYVARFGDYDALWADAKTRLQFLGDLNCYYWLFRTGAPVPPFEQWMQRHDKDHPRMREMVLLGRQNGTSSEDAPAGRLDGERLRLCDHAPRPVRAQPEAKGRAGR